MQYEDKFSSCRQDVDRMKRRSVMFKGAVDEEGRREKRQIKKFMTEQLVCQIRIRKKQ